MTQGLKSRAALEYVAWLAVAAFFYGFSFSFAGAGNDETLGPAVWPRVFCFVLLIVATLHLARGMDEEEAIEDAGPAVLPSLKLFVVPILFVFLIPRIGFYPATVLFLLGQLLVLGERRPVVLATATIGIAAAIFLVFTTIFFVAVPLGTWPGFNEMNGRFVTLLR